MRPDCEAQEPLRPLLRWAEDREVPRPDPAADPRWEAAIRARGTRPPITRDDPGTTSTVAPQSGVISANGTNGSTPGTSSTVAGVISANGTNGATLGATSTVAPQGGVISANGTNGATLASTYRGTTRVRRSAVHAGVAITPAK